MVKRRFVYQSPDTIRSMPQRHHRRFVRGIATFARTWNVTVAASELAPPAEHAPAHWTVTTLREQLAGRCHLRAAVVGRHRTRRFRALNVAAARACSVMALFDFFRTATVFRYFRAQVRNTACSFFIPRSTCWRSPLTGLWLGPRIAERLRLHRRCPWDCGRADRCCRVLAPAEIGSDAAGASSRRSTIGFSPGTTCMAAASMSRHGSTGSPSGSSKRRVTPATTRSSWSATASAPPWRSISLRGRWIAIQRSARAARRSLCSRSARPSRNSPSSGRGSHSARRRARRRVRRGAMGRVSRAGRSDQLLPVRSG